MKRRIIPILVVVLSVALIVGCGNGNDEQMASQLENFVYDESKASWEQDTSPIEIDWFVAYDWAAMNFDPENNTFDQYVYENTGVTINFTIGSQEKLNVLMATDKLPDIVTYDAVSAERVTLEDSGMLLPLNELKDAYAPDMQIPQQQIDWYTNEKDGNWYAMVGYFYDLQDTYERGGYIESHNMNFARQDIMNDLGIDPAMMTTKDGFIEALQIVKDAKVEYQGQTVIPYIGDDIEYLAEQFGADREDSAGNLLNIQRQGEYLEALLFLNEIYIKNLTTDEIFTMNSTLRRQLVTSGAIFSGTRLNYLNGKQDLYYQDPEALMINVGLITGDGGKDAIISPSPTAGWAATMITKNAKNPQRAVALLSFLTKEEISLAYYYGGIDGYDIVDGQAIINQKRETERSSDATAFNAKHKSMLQDLVCDYVWIKKYEPTENIDAVAQDLLDYQKEWVDGNIYDDKIFTDVNPEGGSDLAAVAAQIRAYWGPQFAEIVLADSAAEAREIYYATIEEMDKMGMEKLDDFKNEKFQKNKAKMGVEFAWPRNN